MIKDLISVWDGDVECKVRQDKMYINKVPQPKPQLWIVEGNNITSGNAKVTDYNSDTINTLNVLYNDKQNSITITDEYLVNRFGTVEAEIEAEKIVTDYSGDGSLDGSVGSGGGSTGSDGKKSEWTQIAEILQKYYQSNDWDSFIRNVMNAKTREEIRKLVVGHKWKDNKEQSHNKAIHELLVVKGLE